MAAPRARLRVNESTQQLRGGRYLRHDAYDNERTVLRMEAMEMEMKTLQLRALLIFSLLVLAGPIILNGQQLSDANACSGKRASLAKLEGQAPSIRAQLANKEAFMGRLNGYIARVKNGSLNSLNIAMERERQYSRIRSREQWENTTMTAAQRRELVESLFVERQVMFLLNDISDTFQIHLDLGRLPRTERDYSRRPQHIRLTNEINDLRRQQETIGYQINILRQSMDSLGCDRPGATTTSQAGGRAGCDVAGRWWHSTRGLPKTALNFVRQNNGSYFVQEEGLASVSGPAWFDGQIITWRFNYDSREHTSIWRLNADCTASVSGGTHGGTPSLLTRQ